MSLKDALKDIACINTKLNASMYRRLGSHADEMTRLVTRLGAIDSIADVDALKEFRRSVDAGQSSFYTTDANRSNTLIYGIWESMFGAGSGVESYKTPAIEHGLIFAPQIFTDVRFTARASVATLGPYRKDVIQRFKGVPVFCVGPYIQYAADYYEPEKFAALKAKLGRTLLVFPAHSTDTSSISRDQQSYIDQVAEIARDFDSVLVSAFWWNLNDPIIDAFEAQGYRTVCAGFRDDPHFLSRLKTVISLSDLIVGDGVGTHVGYALNLGVPYRLLPVDSDTEFANLDERAAKAEVDSLKRTVGLPFLGATAITDEQIAVCEPYWGLSISRTREELADIMQITERICDEAHGWTGRFSSVAESLLREYRASDSQKYALLADALL